MADAAPPAAGATTLERFWLVYLGCVALVALAAPGGAMAAHRPYLFLLVQAPVLLAVLACRWLARARGPAAARWLRAAVAVVGLPTVFSSLCWLLPAVHPEPYEFLWLELDRAVFGDDLARLASDLPPWLVELLQLDYAAFYFLCIASAVLSLRASGGAAFDRAMLLLVGGFLVSYLGYLLVPTVGPKVVLTGLPELQGLWLSSWLRTCIDAAEASHWDCFPSGHTMMTITSLIVLWRWARRWFWALLAPGLVLIASTMLLRYHWSADVLAGALLAWPCAWLCGRLGDVDGWPRA